MYDVPRRRAVPVVLLLADDRVHHLGRLVVVCLAVGIGIGLAGRHGRVNRGDIHVKRGIALSDASPDAAISSCSVG